MATKKRKYKTRPLTGKKSLGDKKDKMVKLKTSTHKRLKIMAAHQGKQISDLVEELLTSEKKLR